VPALALPAIALGCLAGAAVLVKSGRDDPLSAPAFQRALAAVDPELAATVVTTYWPGGAAIEDTVLAPADVIVATGGDVALAALGARFGARMVAHGPRWSVALIGHGATGRLDAIAATLARDTVAHDQRGCLSPHALYVEGGADAVRALAEALASALLWQATCLPPGPATVEERAAVRVFRAGAEWEPDTVILGTAEGTVVHQARPATFLPTCGRRTVRVHPLPSLPVFPALLPAGTVECVGVAAVDPTPLVERLRARGVARLCPVGRMQQPRLTWPRGQLPPLGALLGRHTPPEIEVEPCATS